MRCEFFPPHVFAKRGKMPPFYAPKAIKSTTHTLSQALPADQGPFAAGAAGHTACAGGCGRPGSAQGALRTRAAVAAPASLRLAA